MRTNYELKINYENIIGQIINGQRVLNFYRISPEHRKEKNIPMVESECLTCGYVCEKRYKALKNGGCWSCYNIRSTLPTLCGKITKERVESCQKGASDRNLVFDVTAEYLWDVWLSQNERCYFTDILLEFEKHSKARKKGMYTASIDRIDSNYGYIEGNIQWVHKHINKFKTNYSGERYISICNLIDSFDGKFIPITDYQETKNHHYWTGFGGLSGFYWTSINKKASGRGLKLNIIIEEAWQKFLDQGAICAMTGQHINLVKTQKDRAKLMQTASLDRIDSSKDYSVENCMWVHKYVNQSRWDFELEYYREMCKLVSTKHPRNRSEIPLLENIP